MSKKAAGRKETDWDWVHSQKRWEERQLLYEHFAGLSLDRQVHGWDHFWRLRITPWDRLQCNPAIIDALNDRPDIFGPAFKQIEGKKNPVRRRAFVPGCGRGYDVLLFASYGFNCVGIDAAPAAREEALAVLLDPDRDTKYPIKNAKDGRGEARFITGDVFSNNFLSETHGATAPDHTRKFDIIYDCNFLSALPIEFRARWSLRMSQLLAPTGRLICVEYPNGKDPALGGPPHGLDSELFQQLLARPGQHPQYDDSGRVYKDATVELAENGLERVEYWKPLRTFDDQVNLIKISVYAHQGA